MPTIEAGQQIFEFDTEPEEPITVEVGQEEPTPTWPWNGLEWSETPEEDVDIPTIEPPEEDKFGFGLGIWPWPIVNKILEGRE